LLVFALVLGFKHSLEADHLLAVGALLTRSENCDARRAAQLGAWWGLGHTATLVLAGGVVIGLRLLLQRELPIWVEVATERAVALMLVILGAKALYEGAKLLATWRRGRGHICLHQHETSAGPVAHLHFHEHGEHACADVPNSCASDAVYHHNHAHSSFWVGTVHGLAGSGGLMLLVLGAIPQPVWALTFVGVFGIGTVGGMSLVTILVAWSLRASEKISVLVPRLAQGLAGTASLGFGLHLLRASF
jgi:hypothetical protein